MNRRDFLWGATLAGVAGLGRPSTASAEPAPEITTIRLGITPGTCVAPQYIVEDLLRAEGFTDVEYVKAPRLAANRALASGETTLGMGSLGPYLVQIDAGDPIVLLSGVHVGCFTLFAGDRVRSIRDLKGKTVGVTEPGSGRHIFLAAAMAYVGIDPRKDVQFAVHSPAESIRLLAEGKIEAYQAFSEEVAELRARKIGRVILDSTTERPWSQYFCCMLAANRSFVRRAPVATRRAVRAMLKATLVCAAEPDRVARTMVDKGYSTNFEYARQTLRALSYTNWRDHDPGDSIRFHAVRLHEAGMIRSTPQKLIAQGADWHFLEELRKELKG